MTWKSSFLTVATSIAGLTVTGVSIKDTTAIPESCVNLCPVMIPESQFITNYSSTRMTFGSNGTGKVDVKYMINYRFLFAPTGSGVSQLDVFQPCQSKIQDILDVIRSNDTVNGAIDININSVGDVAQLQDPAGNTFWGAKISIDVLEYVQ